jgi:hypothetical protein
MATTDGAHGWQLTRVELDGLAGRRSTTPAVPS